MNPEQQDPRASLRARSVTRWRCAAAAGVAVTSILAEIADVPFATVHHRDALVPLSRSVLGYAGALLGTTYSVAQGLKSLQLNQELVTDLSASCLSD